MRPQSAALWTLHATFLQILFTTVTQSAPAFLAKNVETANVFRTESLSLKTTQKFGQGSPEFLPYPEVDDVRGTPQFQRAQDERDHLPPNSYSSMNGFPPQYPPAPYPPSNPHVSYQPAHVADDPPPYFPYTTPHDTLTSNTHAPYPPTQVEHSSPPSNQFHSTPHVEHVQPTPPHEPTMKPARKQFFSRYLGKLVQAPSKVWNAIMRKIFRNSFI